MSRTPHPAFARAKWRKSSHSDSGNDTCVEAAGLASVGAIGVRDSVDPDGPAFALSPAIWRSLTSQIKAGELDL